MPVNLILPDPVAFWSKAAISEGCWEWQYGKDNNGYGQSWMVLDGKTLAVRAHRVGWMQIHGFIPTDIFVLHDCPGGNDNPACIRPTHLFLGTQRDNMLDRDRKGRHPRKLHPELFINTIVGKVDGRGRLLTPGEVAEIKRLHFVDGVRQIHIAQQLGLHRQQVNHIVTGRTWKEIEVAS